MDDYKVLSPRSKKRAVSGSISQVNDMPLITHNIDKKPALIPQQRPFSDSFDHY